MRIKKHIHIKELSENDDLKPCPFCGAEDIELTNTWTACYWVQCLSCGASAFGEGYPDSDSLEDHKEAAKEAIEAWNQRI